VVQNLTAWFYMFFMSNKGVLLAFYLTLYHFSHYYVISIQCKFNDICALTLSQYVKVMPRSFVSLYLYCLQYYKHGDIWFYMFFISNKGVLLAFYLTFYHFSHYYVISIHCEFNDICALTLRNYVKVMPKVIDFSLFVLFTILQAW